MYPRSGFRSGGTCKRTLVPVFVLGEHPNVPSFRFSFRRNIRQNHPLSGVPGVRWDRVYGTNLAQVGPNMAKLDLLGQVGRHFAVFCLLGKAPLANLDQVGLVTLVLFPTVFRALLTFGNHPLRFLQKETTTLCLGHFLGPMRRPTLTCGVVPGERWTGSANKSIDQIGTNCPKNVRKLCLQPLRTFFRHFSVGVPQMGV